MKKFFVCLLFCAFAAAAFSQIAHPAILSLQGYGGTGTESISSSVSKTIDGGFIVSINTNSNQSIGSFDNFCSATGWRTLFLKYNADASVLEWSKCYGTTGDSAFSFCFPVAGGDLILTGLFTNAGYGFLICKQDVSGNILWQKNYSKGNASIVRDVIATTDGGYIMMAESHYTDSNVSVHYGGWMDRDFWVMKLDADGIKLWSKVIGGSGDEMPAKLIEAPGDGCYVVGTTQSNDYDCTNTHGGSDGYVARLDKDGNIIWHKNIGGTDGDGFSYACSDGKGGLIIAGNTLSIDGDVHHNTLPGKYTFWVLQVDSSSNILWENCYVGNGTEYVKTVCKGTDGSIWLAGNCEGIGGLVDAFYDNPGGLDAWIVHIDSTGNFLGARVMGSSGNDYIFSLIPLPGGLVFAGGAYGDNDGVFENTGFYGKPSDFDLDAFWCKFASWTTNIKDCASTNSLSIYPNPTHKIMTIETNDGQVHEVVISEITGREVYRKKIKEREQVSTNNWETGIYVVQLINLEGVKEAYKIEIQ